MPRTELVLHLEPGASRVLQVCVFIPAWFGVASTAFLGLLTFECGLAELCGSLS